jgi:hypothetical protein
LIEQLAEALGINGTGVVEQAVQKMARAESQATAVGKKTTRSGRRSEHVGSRTIQIH